MNRLKFRERLLDSSPVANEHLNSSFTSLQKTQIMKFRLLPFLFIVMFPIASGIIIDTDDSPDAPPVVESQEFECTVESTLGKVLKLLLGNSKPSTPNGTIALYLSTRTQKMKLIAESGQSVDVAESDFQVDRKTVIIVHGFNEDIYKSTFTDLVDAYLDYEDVNIILVDWGVYAKTYNYVEAANSVIQTAKEVVSMLLSIVDNLKTKKSWQPIHIIANSLGVHLSGIIVAKFKGHSNLRISRVTALDPAGPCFINNKVFLNKDDVPFVDVIHTNGRNVLWSSLGRMEPLGHIDFYVNGGERQPNCRTFSFLAFTSLQKLTVDISEAICSHAKAAWYFTESLQKTVEGKESTFIGIPWDNTLATAIDYTRNGVCTKHCAHMGIKATRPPTEALMGKYFVATSVKSPYSVMKDSDRPIIEKILVETVQK